MDETIDPDDTAGKTRQDLRSIAATERETGLSKETLRMWERRYGFPSPQRDEQGERVYPPEQVARLRQLKRLLDGGHRPGRIVHLSDADLRELTAAPPPAPAPHPPVGGPDLDPLLRLVFEHDIAGLRRRLAAALARQGLAGFATQVAAPLCTQIGDAWMRGAIEVWQEHLATEVLQSVLRQGIARLPDAAPQDRPCVLLGTLTGELHGIGLLMAEALFADAGAHCVSLGVQAPAWDFVLAARALEADIVALSFSGCLAPGQVSEALAELREKLPVRVELWTGGSAPVLRRRPTAGVRALASLSDIRTELARWRAPQADAD